MSLLSLDQPESDPGAHHDDIEGDVYLDRGSFVIFWPNHQQSSIIMLFEVIIASLSSSFNNVESKFRAN